ncbi:MAG: hypothetical protein ACYS0G_04170 [Planctomycetota bacterium]|jgi:hypothetical protein
MLRKRSLLAGVCLAAGASLGLSAPAQAGGDCFVFFDQAVFEIFNQEQGKVLKGLEDFEPPVSNLGFGQIAVLQDPLLGNVPNVDPASGLGFPNGLLNKNLAIQSNIVTENAPDITPGSGLVALGPGFVDPGPPAIPNSVKVGANTFLESIDLIFDPGENHTGVGFTVEDPIAGIAHITVFNKNNEVVWKEITDVPTDGSKFFFGIWCAETIGRINVGGPGGEIVDDIQMWLGGEQEPTCPWDCGRQDKFVGVADLLALLAGWGQPGPCDFDGGGVFISDLLELLGHWGVCPAPVNDECTGALPIDATDDGIIEAHFDMYGARPSPEPYKCLPEEPIHKDIWYCLTNLSDTKKGITISTNLPLFVEVNAGCTCPPGPLVACGPGDKGLEQFSLQAGEQVSIRLINWLDLPNPDLKGTLFVDVKTLPSDGVNFFTDRVEFDIAIQQAGKFLKTLWNFKPNAQPDNSVVALDDVLDIFTHGDDPDDPWTDKAGNNLWPPDVDNVVFSSNLEPQGPLSPHGLDGLAFVTPGFLGITNNALLANFFVDSFDIVSGPPAGDNHTAMALELISLAGDPNTVFHVTVYDKNDEPLGKFLMTGAPAEKSFLGILTKDPAITIGRVDIWDESGGAEGISSFELYFQDFPNPPNCPGQGPCLWPNPTPGCHQKNCCLLVCEVEPFCCDVLWDDLCAAVAQSFTDCECPWDLNGDKRVGVEDEQILEGLFGPCPPPCPPFFCVGDFDKDCVVGPLDLIELLAHFGPCP